MTKVDELPLNILSSVFLLFKDKHVMIEELLQFLISIVDAKLLKAIRLAIN